MTEQQIANALLLGMMVAWICKIHFHFVYLKATDEAIKASSFVMFYLNISNIFTSILIIFPMFFYRPKPEEQKIKKAIQQVKLSTYTFWTIFALAALYLYQHPPTQETTIIKYDLTQDLAPQ